ncbi:unnamed protein product [Thelazia callipaeda]|uniref:fatty acid amide hydrolase n=1 Tax=Thelazia callipaeda TaxID=103827 RepID=A0A0N5D2A8_THECL|nr:unnamed protein product [Thelazia callipaeda]
MIVYIITISILALYIASKWWLRRKQKEKLQLAVQECLQCREKTIEEVSAKCAEVPVERKEMIAKLDLKQLIQCLQSGKCTAKEVLRTYQEKAIQAHYATNCVTTFITESDWWAEELDEQAKSQTYQRPPLFGIPISVKESIKIKGYAQTRGYAQDLTNLAAEDALLIHQIKELGAVPFVLTNVPQSLLSFSCSNPIYGTTINIHDRKRTCGGSSGGEAALISFGGSILGIGGDVGGSIRYPCHFCGIAGIKPSHLRLSQQGSLGSVPGRPLVNSSTGPMATHTEELVTFLRIIWSGKWISKHDPYVAPVDWDEQQFSQKKPLRIGYYDDDEWFKPTPALQRAVHETILKLENCGHQLVKFDPPNLTKGFELFIGALTVDGGQYLLDKFNKDLIDKDFETTVRLLHLPSLLKRILGKLLMPLYPRIGQFLCALPINTAELRQTYAEIANYRDLFVHALQSQQIDAIICPVQVLPAIEHHVAMKLISTTSYCGIFNLLDFAAGTVCVTKVNEEDEKKLQSYPETDPWYKTVKEAVKESTGLPVGVQIAAPPYHEETVLRIMSDIER